MPPIIKPGDFHLITNGKSNLEKLFDHTGKLLYTWQVFPHGANGPRQDVTGGDTVAGSYKLGKPQKTLLSESLELVRRPFGWWFIPMLDVFGVEAAVKRAGIGNHGGGRIADFWLPKQQLTYTMGCVRHHNQDIETLALFTIKTQAGGHDIWQTVSQ